VCSAVAQEPCKLTAMQTGTVAGTRDGRTLLLADSCELRLAAIELTDKSRSANRRHVAPGPVGRPNFAPLQSENIGRIAVARGQFVLVEGKVLSVRENGVTIIFESRTALGPRLYRHHFQASSAGIRPRASIRNGWRVIQFGYAVGSNSTAVP